jgi:hypothetical protein
MGRDGDPFVLAVLNEFNAITGLPILLNTSFNRRGEPIVETPEEAMDAFLAMRLDGLWLEDRFIVPVEPADGEPPRRPAPARSQRASSRAKAQTSTAERPQWNPTRSALASRLQDRTTVPKDPSRSP